MNRREFFETAAYGAGGFALGLVLGEAHKQLPWTPPAHGDVNPRGSGIRFRGAEIVWDKPGKAKMYMLPIRKRVNSYFDGRVECLPIWE